MPSLVNLIISPRFIPATPAFMFTSRTRFPRPREGTHSNAGSAGSTGVSSTRRPESEQGLPSGQLTQDQANRIAPAGGLTGVRPDRREPTPTRIPGTGHHYATQPGSTQNPYGQRHNGGQTVAGQTYQDKPDLRRKFSPRAGAACGGANGPGGQRADSNPGPPCSRKLQCNRGPQCNREPPCTADRNGTANRNRAAHQPSSAGPPAITADAI